MKFRIDYSYIEKMLRDYYEKQYVMDGLLLKLFVKEVSDGAHGWFEGDTHFEMSALIIRNRELIVGIKDKRFIVPAQDSEVIKEKEIKDIIRPMFDESLKDQNLKVDYFILEESGVDVYLEEIEKKKILMKR
ncbi:MAG: hypothetical protein II625_03790 [Bacilli bacterium]|nr:hypothetical protein [Bacilli bacterium]